MDDRPVAECLWRGGLFINSNVRLNLSRDPPESQDAGRQKKADVKPFMTVSKGLKAYTGQSVSPITYRRHPIQKLSSRSHIGAAEKQA